MVSMFVRVLKKEKKLAWQLNHCIFYYHDLREIGYYSAPTNNNSGEWVCYFLCFGFLFNEP